MGWNSQSIRTGVGERERGDGAAIACDDQYQSSMTVFAEIGV